jgi:hypothetical protein
VREATLGGAVKRANANLEAAGLPPLPDKLTRTRRAVLSRAFCTRSGNRRRSSWPKWGTQVLLALQICAQAMRLSDEEKSKGGALTDGAFGRI